jgi:hypothetical protein
MLSYLAYSEWKAGKNEMVMNIVKKQPHLKVRIPVCPWYTAWSDHGLRQYGSYYCEIIDKALLRGFNPEIALDLIAIKPSGSKECDMVFREARLTIFNMMKLVFRKQIAPGKRALMPWEYHVGHLYKTFGEAISRSFGERGKEACDRALATFAREFGEKAALIVKSHEKIDFTMLP